MRLRRIALVGVFVLPLAARGQRPDVAPGRLVRVAVASAPFQAPVMASGAWTLRDAWGHIHATGREVPAWRIERRNRRIRAVTIDGSRATPWTEEPFVLSADGAEGRVVWAGHRYRGVLRYVPTDTAIVVVNAVDLEDYLRGVVPLEIGVRSPNESAAIAAQAVAARSYTEVRRHEGVGRPFDLTGGVSDQVYGGADAEHPIADAAIAATSGLVLSVDGRVVRAPYHSTCGGQTAAPSDVWRGGGDEPYLRSVSDRVPGSDRAWCDISPRYRWEVSLNRADLDDAVARYVRSQQGGGVPAEGGIRNVRVVEETRSGRVGTLSLDMDAGALRLRGNEIRYTLRPSRSEILYSTYFSLEPVVGRDGRLMQLLLHGRGNGHGVGMCQWGAIGRARAGHDVRAILAAYYPGTQLVALP